MPHSLLPASLRSRLNPNVSISALAAGSLKLLVAWTDFLVCDVSGCGGLSRKYPTNSMLYRFCSLFRLAVLPRGSFWE
jgi:hypothetical protein